MVISTRKFNDYSISFPINPDSVTSHSWITSRPMIMLTYTINPTRHQTIYPSNCNPTHRPYPHVASSLQSGFLAQKPQDKTFHPINPLHVPSTRRVKRHYPPPRRRVHSLHFSPEQRRGTKTMGNENPAADFKLVGFSNFVRSNPRSDRFKVKRFHHIEFWCGDATNTARRFSWGLGMPLVAKSDLSTGNQVHASYLLRSADLCFLFTAPYSPSIAVSQTPNSASIPSFDHSASRRFADSHGLAVRAVAVEVEDAELAFTTSVAHGAKPSSPPLILDNRVAIAEVQLYGDVVLRYVSYKDPTRVSDPNPDSWFLPGFESVPSSFPLDFGIRRLDHAVGNVPELGPAVSYVKGFTGFHEFAEFTAEDVGTSESGLNSVVLANNDEMVLLPMNEPVFGTKRKSQIQTYLEHNEGAGLQHLALVSEDIFRTLREMRSRSWVGGFEFMPSPPPTYYKNLKNRVGDVLTEEQIKECEELGILVDRDDQGTLLQIFTKPVGDRPTIFIEIIQRVGCMLKDEEGKVYQKGGCGGFGKGNFSELFKSIEEYEKTLEAKQNVESAAA